MTENLNPNWDIEDVYERKDPSDLSSDEIMYIEPSLEEGETIEITDRLEYSDISKDLHDELKRVNGYDGTERIFIMKTKLCTPTCEEKVSSKTKKDCEGRYIMLVLEDRLQGRPRKKKRTKNAVTNIQKKK